MFSMTSTDSMRKLRDDLFLSDKENDQQPQKQDIVVATVKRSSSLKDKCVESNGVRMRRRKHVSFADEEGQSLVQTNHKVLRRECPSANTEHLQRSRVKNIKHSHTFIDGVCLESTLTNANSVVGTILLEESALQRCSSSDKSALTVVYGWNNSKKFSSTTPCCLGAGNRYMFKINAPKLTRSSRHSSQQDNKTVNSEPTNNRLKFYIQFESQRIDNNGNHFTVEFPTQNPNSR